MTYRTLAISALPSPAKASLLATSNIDGSEILAVAGPVLFMILASRPITF
jgi:hypothetical protein